MQFEAIGQALFCHVLCSVVKEEAAKKHGDAYSNGGGSEQPRRPGGDGSFSVWVNGGRPVSLAREWA